MSIDNLPKLILCPLRDSYNPVLGDDVISTQFEHGMPRQRLKGIGQPHRTPIGFRHKAIHQEYLLAFWRLNKAKPFALRLILDNTSLQWYECRFIGQPQLTTLGGGVHEFSIEIVARPKPLNIEIDIALVWAYEQTNGDMSALFNPLEKLVNEALPKAMEGLNA